MQVNDDGLPLGYCKAVRSCYAPTTQDRDVASEAYHKARAFLHKELDINHESHEIDLLACATLQEVSAVVEKAKARYETSTQCRKGALRWLGRFSARVMYYAQILDVLAQHHPEYVALAWGSLKFILTGILNHGRLMAEFSKALAAIGDALRQSKLNAELFKTDAMRDAIAELYAHIMLFFQRAMRWYNRSPAGRAISSIFKPYELEYQDTVDQIKLCAETVHDLASAASRAEIRDINITVNLLRQEMQRRQETLDEMQKKLAETQENHLKMEESVNRTLQVAINHKSVTDRMYIDVQDMTPRIRDIQFSQILEALKPEFCPQQILDRVQSITRRSRSNRVPEPESFEVIRRLETWFSTLTSSLFVLRVGPRAETKAKELVTDIISLLQSKKVNVVWRISSPTKNSYDTIAGLLKTLIFQALQIDCSLLQDDLNEFNVAKFQTTHTRDEWYQLFQRVLGRLSKCFVVIEAHDLYRAHKDEENWVTGFLKTFSDLAHNASMNSNRVKILILDYGVSKGLKQQISSSCEPVVATLRRPVPVPACRKHTVLHRKVGNKWQRFNPKI